MSSKFSEFWCFFMNSLGTRLREIRNTLGLKQSDLPEKFGIGNQKTWSNYETEVSFPPREVFEKLDQIGIDLHWFLTGKGFMYRDKRIHDKNLFEIPFLTREEALKFETGQEIPEPKANSGEYPDYDFVLAPERLLEYSTDLRAFEVFGNSMFPVFKSGDIAIIEATGWNGNGIYLYRMGGGLHVSYAGRYDGSFHLLNELKKENGLPKELPYDAQTFQAIGRVRAIVKDLFAFDWIGGTQPPSEDWRVTD
jgi:transcriptional regulator with XRE-family HTH domain